MDYKDVLQEQVRELQKLQAENLSGKEPLPIKIDNALKIVEQMRLVYLAVKGPID